MNFLEAVINEDLHIDSGNRTLNKLFDSYLKEVFSTSFVNKINRLFDTTLVFNDFKQRSTIMCYTQGTKIYVNTPLFRSVPTEKAMNYIMHEMFHVLVNTHKFPELNAVNKRLLNVVQKGVPKGKESDFFTGKHQNLHSDWHGEVINYLCNNSIDWDVGMPGIKLAYKTVLEESGIFNLSSKFWKKRFENSLDKKEKTA